MKEEQGNIQKNTTNVADILDEGNSFTNKIKFGNKMILRRGAKEKS